MYKSDVEWIDEQFDEQSRAAKLGRLIERYKTEQKQ
jgi:hypothetical protein